MEQLMKTRRSGTGASFLFPFGSGRDWDGGGGGRDLNTVDKGEVSGRMRPLWMKRRLEVAPVVGVRC